MGVNEATGEILAAVASTHNMSDDEDLADTLNSIENKIEEVSGDRAYDKRKCYNTIAAREAQLTISPRKDALMWAEDLKTRQVHPHNENLRRIDEVGRQQWKQQSGHHQRS